LFSVERRHSKTFSFALSSEENTFFECFSGPANWNKNDGLPAGVFGTDGRHNPLITKAIEGTACQFMPNQHPLQIHSTQATSQAPPRRTAVLTHKRHTETAYCRRGLRDKAIMARKPGLLQYNRQARA
jgi:hypothetical protein